MLRIFVGGICCGGIQEEGLGAELMRVAVG
jgi:hypothetical protein